MSTNLKKIVFYCWLSHVYFTYKHIKILKYYIYKATPLCTSKRAKKLKVDPMFYLANFKMSMSNNMNYKMKLVKMLMGAVCVGRVNFFYYLSK